MSTQTTKAVAGGRAVELHCAPLLEAIAGQAAEADRSRSVAPDVLAAIRASELLLLSSSKELGGQEATISQIAAELEAVAGACASTAWCLWNHLCVFHLFCGGFGPAQFDRLAAVVSGRQWVCFPGGAGSKVYATDHGDHFELNGSAAFGSGSRYADWSGVAFGVFGAEGRLTDPPNLQFSMVRLDDPAVKIDPTWDGASLRASSTDDVRYVGLSVAKAHSSSWHGAGRSAFLRDPGFTVIHTRYREDWVGLSDLWLGAMGVGVVQAALDQLVEEVGSRRAIMGRRMADLPGVQINLGEASTSLLGARLALTAGCAEVDARIAARDLPTEASELRQLAVSAFALEACATAMNRLLRVAGGNGLRESHPFERRHRDFQAMPIHINAHRDRVVERMGRFVLGLELDKF